MLDHNFLTPYRAAKDPFKSLLARSTYLGKYKRLEDSCWTDTVARIVLGSAALDKNVSKYEAEFLFDTIWNMYGLPPGRGLWTGGVPNIPIDARYNCHYGTLRSIDDWCWTANMLMCGGGVGVGLHYISELPLVVRGTARLNILCSKSHQDVAEVMPDSVISESENDWYLVSDTREGWVGALRAVLTAAYNSKNIVVNVSPVRKRGSPIKTFGGIACGPAPLVTLLRQVWAIVRSAQGRKLNSVECLDVTNHIGVCIKSGNVRRSALIVLGKADDQDFRNAKKDWQAVMAHRHSSNNSIVFETEEQIDSFDWNALVEDASVYGEPGIVNLWKARQTEPGVQGTNPCFDAHTRIHTKQGHFEIKDLVGRTVDVWDGERWRTVNTFRKTSQNELMMKFTLYDGSSFRVTSYHIIITDDCQRIEARDVQVGTKLRISNAPISHGNLVEPGAYAKGFMIGDGCFCDRSEFVKLYLYEPKYICGDRICKSVPEIPVDENLRSGCILEPSVAYPVNKRAYVRGLSARSNHLRKWVTDYKKNLPKSAFEWDILSKSEFIAGYLDAVGAASVAENGFMYQVTSIERGFLEDFQELLKTIGVSSNLILTTQDCYRLTITQGAAIILSNQVQFSRLQSMSDQKTTYNLKSKYNKIVSIEYDGVDDEVYCLVTDDPDQIACSNGLIIGRCGEILLEDREACCLSELFPASWVGNAEKIVTAMTRYTLRQRLQPMTDGKADDVRKKNMRIGVGLGGICDFAWDALWLASAQSVVREAANKYAKELGVSTPIATTTIKPSGTISLLNGSSPGVHAPFAPFYVRRTRIAKNEPMAESLFEAGVPFEQCVYDNTGQTLVFSFPMKAKNTEKTVQNETVRDQIERQVTIQKWWADNSVSSTISFGKEEKGELASLLHKHAKNLKSISCLPKNHGYQQPPYEEITASKYGELYSQINHDHPLTSGGELDTLECEGGACPVR